MRYEFHCADTTNLDGVAEGFPTFKKTFVEVEFDEATTWDRVMDEFVSFLSGVYGYDIHRSVKYDTIEDKITKLREKGVLGDDDPWADAGNVIDEA